MSKIRTAINAYVLNPAVTKAALAAGRLAAPAQPAVTGPPKGILRPGPPKGIFRPGVHAPPATSDQPITPTNPMPWDAAYEGTVDAAIANRDATYASIDNAVNATKQAFGFDDLSNPFSKIALLKESFANAQRGTTNSMAGQGQLYSGAIGNARAIDQHNYDVNYDADRRSYDQTLAGLADRRTQAKNTETDAEAAANLTRVQTALANRPDPATLPAPVKGKQKAPTPKAPAKGKGKK